MIYGVSTEDEIIKYLKDANSKIIFTLDIFSSKFENVIDRADIVKVIVVGSQNETALCKPFTSWNEFMKNQRHTETVSRNPEAVAVITYTGGTTGGSKGVMLSNNAVVANSWQYCRLNIPLKRTSKWMMVFPLFIAFGIFSLTIPLSVPIPDETINEAPVAYIIPKKDYSNDNNLATELKQYCEGCLQDVYRPSLYIYRKISTYKGGKSRLYHFSKNGNGRIIPLP